MGGTHLSLPMFRILSRVISSISTPIRCLFLSSIPRIILPPSQLENATYSLAMSSEEGMVLSNSTDWPSPWFRSWTTSSQFINEIYHRGDDLTRIMAVLAGNLLPRTIRDPDDHQRLLRLEWELSGLLFPQSCCVCLKPSGSPLCQKCLSQIEPLAGRLCSICGKPYNRFFRGDFAMTVRQNRLALNFADPPLYIAR